MIKPRPKRAEGGAVSTPLLRRGSRDPDAVKRLQEALNARGASIDVDGVFGPQTSAAVRAFQTANKLDVDGVVGNQTWGALNAASAPATPLPGPRADSTAQRFPSAADRAANAPPAAPGTRRGATGAPTRRTEGSRTAPPAKNAPRPPKDTKGTEERRDTAVGSGAARPEGAPPRHLREFVRQLFPTGQEALMSGTQPGFGHPGGLAVFADPEQPFDVASAQDRVGGLASRLRESITPVPPRVDTSLRLPSGIPYEQLRRMAIRNWENWSETGARTPEPPVMDPLHPFINPESSFAR